MNHFDILRLAPGDKRLNARDFKILMFILSKVPVNSMQSYICRKELSEATGLSVNKISNHTKRLSDFGWLKKEGNGGRSSYTSYTLTMPDLGTVNNKTVPEIDTVSNPKTVPEMGNKRCPKMGGAKENPNKNPIIKENNKKKKIPIPDNWHPSERCFELIGNHGIDLEFARSLIDEFIFYWHERGDKRPGWDSTFLNNVKANWARNHGKNIKNNQSAKIQKLQESNLSNYERIHQLEREIEIEEKRECFSEIMDTSTKSLPAPGIH